MNERRPQDLPTWQRPHAAGPAATDPHAHYPPIEPPIFAHFGVYGVFLEAAQVLVIRKSRGPYTGLLDLPGGTPEPDETHDQTLARELLEETGGRLQARLGPWHDFAFCVAVASDGTRVGYDHRGRFARVQIEGVAADLPVLGPHDSPPDLSGAGALGGLGARPIVEDVAGLGWLPLASWSARADLSSALRAALQTLFGPATSP